MKDQSADPSPLADALPQNYILLLFHKQDPLVSDMLTTLTVIITMIWETYPQSDRDFKNR